MDFSTPLLPVSWRRPCVAAGLALSVGAGFGCASKEPVAPDEGVQKQQWGVVAPSEQAETADAEQPTGFVVDGMIGQVNGRAIYSDTILGPVHEQLGALGREMSPAAFRQEATNIITNQVRETIINQLILAEAERNLNANQTQGVSIMVRKHREEILRKYGQNSLALAERNLYESTGKTISETLRSYRERLVVDFYFRQTLNPKINVSRRDVERYYYDHPEKYNPPFQRDLRLIRVDNAAASAHILELLAAGESFESVARSEANLFKADTGGLMENAGPLRFEALNKAIEGRTQGQYAGPEKTDSGYWFVYIDKLTGGESQSLQDAQLEIEAIIRRQQFRRLMDQHRRNLLETGSFNPVEEMTQTLVRIAMNRYAQPTSGS